MSNTADNFCLVTWKHNLTFIGGSLLHL